MKNILLFWAVSALLGAVLSFGYLNLFFGLLYSFVFFVLLALRQALND